ncbi:hypothetical protein ILUMI_25801, partial [Ignelater luminosus]
MIQSYPVKKSIKLLCFSVSFLFLFIGSCTSLVCAHCKAPWSGDCVHPLGFLPPYTECGAVKAECATILLELRNDIKTRTVKFNLDYGTREDYLYTFKGCVEAAYCNQTKPYPVLGFYRVLCTTCNTSACNLKLRWKGERLKKGETSKGDTIFPSVAVLQLL